MSGEPRRPVVKLRYENPALDIGIAISALRRAGWKPRELDRFTREATSGDSENVYDVIERYCEVE